MTTSKRTVWYNTKCPVLGTARAAESTLEAGYTFRFPQIESQSSLFRHGLFLLDDRKRPAR